MRGVLAEFRRCDVAQPPAADLLEAVLAEFDADAGRRLIDGPRTTVADFSPPAGAYLVGFVDGEAACGGGIRARDDATAEVKRMYVRPALRRQGLARALLTALEEAARDLGHERLCLDCRFAVWPLYRSAGFVEIADYNGNPHAQVWAHKQL